jgi:hypothetical protein
MPSAPFRRQAARVVAPLLALPLLVACGDVVAPAEAARLTASVDPGEADTIVGVRTLRVTVTTASGRPVAGVQVRAVPVATPLAPDAFSRLYYGESAVGPLVEVVRSERQFAAGAATYDTTDANGGVALRLRAGPAAGTAVLALSVPAAGLVDTARLRVSPGNAAYLHVVSARDTAVSVGRRLVLTARVLDLGYNLRPDDRPRFASSDGALAGSSEGVVTGVTPVRGVVDVRFGALAPEPIEVSVVPAGMLAVRRTTPQGVRLGIMATDGSGFTPIDVPDAPDGRSSHPGDDLHPAWSADGRAVLANTGDAVRRVEPGAASRVVASLPSGVSSPHWRLTSLGGERADGWIHYAVGCGAGELLFRTQPGTGGRTEQLSPDAPDTPEGADTLAWSCNAVRHSAPSPSPDGRRVVFLDESIAPGPPNGLAVLDVATRAVTRLGVWGWRPSWSPDGGQIAYFADGAIWLIRPDGSERRRLAMRGAAGASGVTWSPDGAWLIVRAGSGALDPLVMVEVRTGREIPLPYSYWQDRSTPFTPWYGLPSWRPE